MARSVSSTSSTTRNDKKSVLDIRLVSVLESSVRLRSSTMEGTGDTHQEGRTSSGDPLTTVLSSQEMPHTDSSAAVMKSKMEIMQKHNLPPVPYDLDCEEDPEESYPTYPSETRSRVMQWLDEIPSSPSSVRSDIECSSYMLTQNAASRESLGTSSLMKTPSSIQRRHSKTIRDKVIDNEPLNFSSTPAPLKSYQERSALLDAAEAKFQEWERNKILDSQGYVKPIVIKGVAKWYKSINRKHKAEEKKRWLSPRRFLTWLGSLGFFQWFIKKKTDDLDKKSSVVEGSSGDDRNNNVEDSSPEDMQPFATFVPYEEICTSQGNELSPTCVFGSEPIQDQVESAAAMIASKTRSANSTDRHSRRKTLIGCSDAEGNVLNPNPAPIDSTEELKRLTELLSSRNQSNLKPNSPKMHSIFAVRKEHVRSTTSVGGADIRDDVDGQGGAPRSGFHYLLSRLRRRWRGSGNFNEEPAPGVANPQQLRVTFQRRAQRRIHPYILLQDEANLVHNNNYAFLGRSFHPNNRQEVEEPTIRTFVSRVAQGLMRLVGLQSQTEEAINQNLVLPGEDVIREADAAPFQIFDHPRNTNDNSLNNNEISLNLDLLNQEVLREQIMASQREFITRSPRRPGLLREQFPEGCPQPHNFTNQEDTSPDRKRDKDKK